MKIVQASWIGCLLMLMTLSSACTTARKIHVASQPSGARILIDGEDSGLTTPSQLTLSTAMKSYTIALEKPGYNPIERQVKLGKDVDVIDPDEVAMRVCCAPCCLGLPLLGLLKPVRVKQGYTPSRIDARLDPEGQGLKVKMDPEDAEIYVDGKLHRPLDGHILIMQPGDREIEITRDGYRPYVRVVHIDEKLYKSLDVELEVEGEGLLLEIRPAGAKIYVDEQYQGTSGPEPRRIRTTPGPHSLEIQRDGYQTWTDVILIEADDYRPVKLSLELEGQGVIVHRPVGLRKSQDKLEIRIDGALHGTRFGEPILLSVGAHLLQIKIPGYAEWEETVQIKEGSYLELSPEVKRARR